VPSLRIGLLTIVLIAIPSVEGTGFRQQLEPPSREPHPSSFEGLAAWQQVYSVLTHPRCINCHTAGNILSRVTTVIDISSTSCVGRPAKAFRRCNAPPPACDQGANADTTGVPAAMAGTWVQGLGLQHLPACEREQLGC